MSQRRVLVTGVGGALARLVARDLTSDPAVTGVVALDDRDDDELAPVGAHLDLGSGVEVVRCALGNPTLAGILASEDIDTVVHLATTAGPVSAGGRPRMEERNVVGALALFAACQRADTVTHVVLKSSTAVYGSGSAQAALLREDAADGGHAVHGFGKDVRDIEGYARTLQQQRPDVTLTTLRMANLVGGQVDSVFASFFALPVVPTVLGYDPRIQLLHEDDAVAALRRAVTGEHPGVFNVAGPGILYLSQCIRLASKLPAPVPLPLVSAVAGALTRTGRVDVTPDQLDLLRYGRVGDIGRLRGEMCFEPLWSTRAAFEDFIARRGLSGVADAGELVRLQRDLAGLLRGAASTAATRGDT